MLVLLMQRVLWTSQPIVMPIGLVTPMIAGPPLVWSSSLDSILYLGHQRSSKLSRNLPLKQNTGPYPPPQLSLIGFNNCYNLSGIALSFNPIQHQQTKHIEIDVHFFYERVAKDQLIVQFVSSNEQFADILTKGLGSPLFLVHFHNLQLGLFKLDIEGGG